MTSPHWILGPLAFLIGGLPWAWFFVLVTLKKDIRKHGSGNVGATNAARMFEGRKRLAVFLLIFLLDAGKGYVAAGLLPDWLDLDYGGWPAYAGFCAVLGHVFSIYLRSLGGKGVATTIGVLVTLDLRATAVAMGAFFLVYAFTRIVSASSLAFAVALPLAAWVRGGVDSFFWLSTGLSVLIIARHSSNIRRLLARTEV